MHTFLLLFFGVFTAVSHAQVFDRLYPESLQIPLTQPLEWVTAGTGEVATPDQFSVQAETWRFQPYTAKTTLPTSAKQEVWVRFGMPATDMSQTWFIRIPRITVVKASLYSRDVNGIWQEQSAGESIAPAKWALRTRVPSFELRTSANQAQTYYLRFEHRVAITERPMLVSPIEYIEGSSRVGILIGLLGGMFGLLSVLCMAAFALTRNTVFLWFGSFVMTIMLSQATVLGFGGWRIWPESAHLNQVMNWVSACLALAAGTWFCAKASYAKDSHIRIYRLLGAMAAGSLVLAFLTAANLDVFSRDMRNAWVALVTVLVIGSMAWMTLRGEVWNALLLIGLVPIGLSTMARLVYNMGWVSQMEFAQTAGIFSALVGLLCLMLALVWRARTSLLSSELATAMKDYDASTGLVQERVARSRLQRMLLRANQLKLGGGVIMLSWIDYKSLMASLSPEMQHAILKQFAQVLNKVARDIDTASRFGNSIFLIQVEGPISRSSLSSLSTQILTACIRLSEKFEMPNAFKFHIAIWQANQVPCKDEEVLEALKARLHQMSFGTKRVVQFADAISSDPGPEHEEEFNQRRDDLIAKIDAIEASSSLQAPLMAAADKSTS